MSKKFFSVVLILIGAGLWWALSNSAHLSIKKWDATFEAVFRDALSAAGYSNQDLLESAHELKKDAEGQWVAYHVRLKTLDKKKQAALTAALEASGARVQSVVKNGATTLMISRGSRVYQDIQFPNPK
jgi:hypothetical protein